jgi:hypothetical protein
MPTRLKAYLSVSPAKKNGTAKTNKIIMITPKVACKIMQGERVDMSEFNQELWSKEILKQTKKAFKFAGKYWSDEKVKLKEECSFSFHKYFAFRVEGIEAVQKDSQLVSGYSAQGGRGLALTMEAGIIALIKDLFFEYEVEDFYKFDNLYEGLINEFLNDSLENFCKNQTAIVMFPIEPIRVQAAYDLDYLATSVVGDIQ